MPLKVDVSGVNRTTEVDEMKKVFLTILGAVMLFAITLTAGCGGGGGGGADSSGSSGAGGTVSGSAE